MSVIGNKSSAVAEMGDRLATVDMGRKVAMGCCGGSWVTTGSPSNTMWPGPRPTSLPSGILLHPTVWPQYTNVTDRQADKTDRGDRQRSPKNLEGYSISSEMTLFEGHICYFLSAFLANVNSRSRSLYAIARPSVVCLSSVTFVRPAQAVEIFGNISTALGTLVIH